MHSIHRKTNVASTLDDSLKEKGTKNFFSKSRLQLKFIAIVVKNILLFFLLGYAISWVSFSVRLQFQFMLTQALFVSHFAKRKILFMISIFFPIVLLGVARIFFHAKVFSCWRSVKSFSARQSGIGLMEMWFHGNDGS